MYGVELRDLPGALLVRKFMRMKGGWGEEGLTRTRKHPQANQRKPPEKKEKRESPQKTHAGTSQLNKPKNEK